MMRATRNGVTVLALLPGCKIYPLVPFCLRRLLSAMPRPMLYPPTPTLPATMNTSVLPWPRPWPPSSPVPARGKLELYISCLIFIATCPPQVCSGPCSQFAPHPQWISECLSPVVPFSPRLCPQLMNLQLCFLEILRHLLRLSQRLFSHSEKLQSNVPNYRHTSEILRIRFYTTTIK